MKIGFTRIIGILTLAVLVPTLASAQAATKAGPTLISQAPFAISAKDEAAGIEGIMKVAAEIDKTGKVTRTLTYVGPMWPCTGNLESRVDAIKRAAEKAVKEYKFAPATENGVPVAAEIAVSIPIGRSVRKDDGPSDGPPKEKVVSGGVINGRALSLPSPGYPREARNAHVSGTVLVQVLIGEDGNILKAQAIEGPPILQDAARDAACGSKYSPTTLAGQPVKVSGIINYNFIP